MMNRIRKEQEGLTLIELIVVVAIIGVLAWLITPRVLEALNNSKLQSAVSVATEVQSAMERFATENDSSYAEPDLDPTWLELMIALEDHLTVAQNDTENLDTTTNFDWEADNGTDPPTFCVAVNARDRDETLINITETGITTGALAVDC